MSGEVRVTLRDVPVVRDTHNDGFYLVNGEWIAVEKVVRVERRCGACDGTGEEGTVRRSPCFECDGQGWVEEGEAG